MSYKIIMIYPDGSREEEDDVFETEQDAESYALYLVGCGQSGAETLELSNPGDYPIDNYQDPTYEIINIEN